ncbi:MAG: class I SAM-dependent methyltransferase [Hyphomonadaceae bacterium]|nr:class I SAM-dependent methyltransferase [Hyphomonadaceae bacterium]
MHSSNKILEKVYGAKTDDDRRQAYNEWAQDYDRDVSGFGIQLPYVGASVFARHIELGTMPVLDAACGTGMHTLPLSMMGYSGFHGIDISDGMLTIAKARGCYASLTRMALGKPLDIADDHFAASYCIGALAHGHAPPESLNELIRVTRPGGLIIWSTHAHLNERTQPYQEFRHALTSDRQWIPIFETPPFVSMPDGDSAIQHAVYVYEVCS